MLNVFVLFKVEDVHSQNPTPPPLEEGFHCHIEEEVRNNTTTHDDEEIKDEAAMPPSDPKSTSLRVLIVDGR